MSYSSNNINCSFLTILFDLISYVFNIIVNLECDYGKYGINCQHSCGHCRGGITCNQVDGSCLDGCSEGYNGLLCIDRKY